MYRLWVILKTLFASQMIEIACLKYRLVTDIVRPINEIVRRREETTRYSVRPN
jgi:hypothetical protein